MNNKILMATGQIEIDTMDSYIYDYDIIGVVEYRDELFEAVKDLKPDIVIAGTLLGGKEAIFPILNKIRLTFPDIRIIFLTSEVDITDKVYITSLGFLANMGVYDIIEDNVITPEKIQYILDNPREKDNVIKYLNLIEDSSYSNAGSKIEVVLPDEDRGINNLRSNLISFISSKGGTGKSTLLVNTAIAISEMGVKTEDNFDPKVLMLDLDFYQFTIGRMTNTTKPDNNIFTLIKSIKEHIRPDGTVDNMVLQELIQKVEDASHKVKGYKNLYALTGPDNRFDKNFIESIELPELIFLISVLTEKFDIILVDTGNDLTNQLIYPILKLSEYLYYIMDMNFLTFMQEKSFLPYYKELELDSNIVYVLNKFILNNQINFGLDQINEVGYDISHKVDLYNPITMLNHSYDGTFIINDKSKETEDIRFDILDIADSIWGINNFQEIRRVIKGEEEKIVDLSKDKNLKKKKDKDEDDNDNDDFFSKIGKKLLSKK